MKKEIILFGVGKKKKPLSLPRAPCYFMKGLRTPWWSNNADKNRHESAVRPL